ncbi:hypothetical protein [Spirulina sp. 06S082]|uniref:hypothetical protein n=1 Tax=Spirulina sp. 06S082 TaxID=3110248 RepID=UPI002B1FCD2E|nr:hypothetical protein [Spirulina sp. 06S082]MEA5467315.1 hypothetical protein [Spirulina sp. 06S082]
MVKLKSFVFPLLLLGLTGCNFVGTNQIDRLTPQSAGKIISVSGEAIAQAPFLDRGAYQLENKRGQIWVMSDQTLPAIGAIVKVRGRVEYKSIPLDGQEFGEIYLQELERDE